MNEYVFYICKQKSRKKGRKKKKKKKVRWLFFIRFYHSKMEGEWGREWLTYVIWQIVYNNNSNNDIPRILYKILCFLFMFLSTEKLFNTSEIMFSPFTWIWNKFHREFNWWNLLLSEKKKYYFLNFE